MSRAVAVIAAALALALAAPAAAYVRKTTQEPPYLCLWWHPRQISYQVNAGRYHGPCGGAAGAAASIRLAVPPWSAATRTGDPAACTDFAMRDCGDSASAALRYDGVNLIVVRDNFCTAHAADPVCADPTDDRCIEKYGCWSHDNTGGLSGTLALTTVTYKQASGEIVDADIELNGWDGVAGSGVGFYFTCADPVESNGLLQNLCPDGDPYAGTGCVAFDVRNTVTHESGHVLGLDHSQDPSATMAASAPRGDVSKRALHSDDVEGVCSIYPAGASTLTCTTPQQVAPSAPQACPVPKSSGGCAAGEGGGALALVGVALASLRRRRQRTMTPA